MFEAHPGCVRAVRDTADLLKKDGHDVVEVRTKLRNLWDDFVSQ